MSNVKNILKAVFNALDNYDGDISCRKIKSECGANFYIVETNGNTFEAICYDSEPDIVFYHEDGVEDWYCSEGLPVVVMDNMPRIIIGTELLCSPNQLPSFLAREAGCSVATVYNYAKRLGRLPTVQELRDGTNRRGRPRKYNY